MALTKAQLRNKVLRRLAILPEGQVASSWQAEVVDDCIDQSQKVLEDEGIAYWETSAIPDRAAIGFRDFVAGRVCGELMGEEQSAPYLHLEAKGHRELVRVTAAPNQSVKQVYF